jgi:uncharacterized DUF497 family protein
MMYTWDQRKSDANLRDRGFDFEFATLVFESPTLEREDRRKPYGETRTVAVGLAGDQHLTVVYTDRRGPEGTDLRRIISARRSSRREREAYRKAIQQGPSLPRTG